MAIITRKPVLSTKDSLTKRSSEILSVFTKTQQDLEAVNAEIVAHVSNKREEAQKILDEIAHLEGVASQNDNLSKKIQSFINN